MAWSVLQSAGQTVTNLAATFTSNVSSGSKIIAALSTNASGASVTSVKDGAGNSWTQIKTASYGTYAFGALYALDTPAGDVGTKPTITAVLSGGGGSSYLMVLEVSGLAAGNTVAAMCDGSPATLTGITGTTGSPSYSTTAANEFLTSVYADGGDAYTLVQPTGWTLDPDGQNSSSLVTLCYAYHNSTGGSESASWTSADATTGWALIEVAFKLAGGGPSTGPAIHLPNQALRARLHSQGQQVSQPGLVYVRSS